METIINSLKYPFQDKNWIRKFGITALIILGICFLNSIGSLGSSFSPSEAGKIANEEIQTLFSLFALGFGLFSIFISLITLPFTFYLLGYFITTAKGVMNNEENPSQTHDDIMGKALKGVLFYALSFIISIPFAIINFIFLAIVFGTSIFLVKTMEQTVALTIPILIIGLLTFIILFFFMALAYFTYLSAYYLYVSTDSFSKALNVRKIATLIKKHWKDYILAIAKQFIVSITAVLAGIMSIFTMFLASPIIITSMYYSVAYIYGDLFKRMKMQEGGSQKT